MKTFLKNLTACMRNPGPSDLPSNGKFGWFFSAVFATVTVYACMNANMPLAASTAISSVLVIAVTIMADQLLAPLNRLWYGLGIMLGSIISPVVLSLIFFLLITPVSLMTRFLGRDVLLMKKRRDSSYWVDREPTGPSPESFQNQF